MSVYKDTSERALVGKPKSFGLLITPVANCGLQEALALTSVLHEKASSLYLSVPENFSCFAAYMSFNASRTLR